MDVAASADLFELAALLVTVKISVFLMRGSPMGDAVLSNLASQYEANGSEVGYTLPCVVFT